MNKITITAVDATTYEVTVESQTTTRHTVTADPAYVAALSPRPVPTETVLLRSFEFLLEREPNTSILSRFDLPVIARYFPEYEPAIRSRLQAD